MPTVSTATAKRKRPARPATAKSRRPTAESKKATKTQARAVPRTAPAQTYQLAVGRRKSAIARVRYNEKGSGSFLVNGQDVSRYFPTFELQKTVHDPIEQSRLASVGDVSVKVQGGGKRGQAEAIRLGLSRVLVQRQPDLRSTLKKLGFLTRDPRVKERKKYGLKRARRAPQWQKR
jgi:small subunit ribosomal protein S9